MAATHARTLYLDQLAQAVTTMHGKCHHVRTEHVHETMGEQTVWKGDVEVFVLIDHPRASKAFAWTWDDHGETRYIAVLNEEPIGSPRDAVQAALAGDRRRYGS